LNISFSFVKELDNLTLKIHTQSRYNINIANIFNIHAVIQLQNSRDLNYMRKDYASSLL